MKKSIMFLALVLLCAGAYAQEEPVELGELVVTPTKIQEPAGALASSVSVVTEKQLQKENFAFAKDSLRLVPGLDIVQTGGFGGPTSCFIRGAERRHTMVLIDGIKVYDPIATDGAFDLTHVTADNISRIEIVRGPQSALYGSDAIGGVINIITKKGMGAPSVFFSQEAGWFDTKKEAVQVQGQSSIAHYSFSASRFDTHGYSQAREKDNNPEKDPYHNTSFSGRLDFDLSDSASAGVTGRFTHTKFEYDDAGGPGGDDPDIYQKQDQTILSFYFAQKILDFWKHKLTYGFTENKRRDFDESDAADNGEYLRDWYGGRSYQFEWQNDFLIGDVDTMVLGVAHMKEEGDSYYYNVDPLWGVTETDQAKAFSRTTGYYIENRFHPFEWFSATQGFRLEDHQMFGRHTTYKLDAQYTAPSNTKIKAGLATGFKAPTLYQLYAPALPLWLFTGGNPQLKPEKSQSWECGLEQGFFKDRLKFGVTYFHSHFKDLITYYTDPTTFSSTYMNTGKARVRGWEVTAGAKPFDWIEVYGNYSRTKTLDKDTHLELLRRPVNKFSVTAVLKPVEKLEVVATMVYVGHRDDIDAVSWLRTVVESYTKVDLSTNLKLNDNITLFGRIENLLDRDYQEVPGYQAPRFAAYGGLKARF